MTSAQKQRLYRERQKAKASGAVTPTRSTVTPTSGRNRRRDQSAPGNDGPPELSTLEACEANVARLQRQAEEIENDAEASPADKATIGRALSAAINQLTIRRGEETITEQKIVRAPAFARVLDVIDRVATEHPGPWVRAMRQGLGLLQ